jgi:hypothetical protein
MYRSTTRKTKSILLCRHHITLARVAQWVRALDYLTTHTSLSPIRRGFAPGFVNYKKRCTRLAAASDKVYQLLAHGRWFSPGTLASSTTKTGRHDISEMLLKVALNTKNQINSKWMFSVILCLVYACIVLFVMSVIYWKFPKKVRFIKPPGNRK